MFRLDDRTDEESQGIEERLHRGVSSEIIIIIIIYYEIKVTRYNMKKLQGH